jgi:hypothetical protein
MDASHFDRWTQNLTTTKSRRQTLRGLLVGARPLAASVLLATSLKLTEARKKRKNKRKKKCKAGTKKCGKTCIPADTCCSDAECGAQLACIGGKCAVPCGQPCDDLFGVCFTSVDGADVCTGAQDVDVLCAASPCTADSQCGATEFCSPAGCPPAGGITNRCQALLLS